MTDSGTPQVSDSEMPNQRAAGLLWGAVHAAPYTLNGRYLPIPIDTLEAALGALEGVPVTLETRREVS